MLVFGGYFYNQQINTPIRNVVVVAAAAVAVAAAAAAVVVV
jgi:hypothetical protein